MNETIICVKEASPKLLFHDVTSIAGNLSLSFSYTYMQLASQLGSFPWEMDMLGGNCEEKVITILSAVSK